MMNFTPLRSTRGTSCQYLHYHVRRTAHLLVGQAILHNIQVWAQSAICYILRLPCIMLQNSAHNDSTVLSSPHSAEASFITLKVYSKYGVARRNCKLQIIRDFYQY